MKIAIYGDIHISKKLTHISDSWDESILTTFDKMYKVFKEQKVDKAVCLGDFFDSSILEARFVKKITEVLSIINNADFKTHIVLGNHEVHGQDDNILEFLNYENIIPEILLREEESLLFVPNIQNLEEIDPDMIKDKIVFTHHDIYGSELAGGRVKSAFGTDPTLLKDAKIVFNGHVHNRSRLGNIVNAGSLFTTQFGELSEVKRDKPCYYILDTETLEFTEYVNEDSIMFITVHANTLKKDLSKYKNNKKVVRVLYDNEDDIDKESLESDPSILKVAYRKVLKNSDTLQDVVFRSNEVLDLKAFILQYIDKDDSVLPQDKSRLVELSSIILST